MDEDAVLTAIGKLQGQMEGIDSRLDRIETNQNNGSGNCQKCRTEIDAKIQVVHSRVNKIVKTHTGEAAVQSWTDSIFTKVAAGLVAICSIVGLVLGIKGGS